MRSRIIRCQSSPKEAKSACGECLCCTIKNAGGLKLGNPNELLIDSTQKEAANYKIPFRAPPHYIQRQTSDISIADLSQAGQKVARLFTRLMQKGPSAEIEDAEITELAEKTKVFMEKAQEIQDAYTAAILIDAFYTWFWAVACAGLIMHCNLYDPALFPLTPTQLVIDAAIMSLAMLGILKIINNCLSVHETMRQAGYLAVAAAILFGFAPPLLHTVILNPQLWSALLGLLSGTVPSAVNCYNLFSGRNTAYRPIKEQAETLHSTVTNWSTPVQSAPARLSNESLARNYK